MKNKILKEVVITEDMLSSTDTTIGELLDKAVFEARIEEMAKVIRPILEERVDIGFIPDLDKPIAKELIKQDYCKIPEGSIVVNKEYLKKELQWLERQARKETAENFAEELKHYFAIKDKPTVKYRPIKRSCEMVDEALKHFLEVDE